MARWSLIAVVAITALAFGLRLINLGYSDLTFDESASYFVASKPLAEMIPYLAHAFHEHPPAFFVTLAGWMQLVGTREAMLRMLSVMLGTLSIPLMFQLGRKAIGVRAGIVAALLLSVTPVHIFYSQNARMYAMLGALALLSWWLILQLQTKDQVRYWLALSACGLIGLAAHYYMGLVIASQAAYLLATWRQNKRLLLKWSIWLGVPLALIGLYIVASPGVLGTVRSALRSGLGSRLTAGALRGLAADMIFGPHGNTLGITVWMLVLALVVIGIGLALSGRVGVKRSVGVMLICAILVPLVLMALLPESIAVRYVLFLIFPIVLALTIAVLSPLSLPISQTARRRWLWMPTTILIGILIALNVTRLPYHYDALNSDYGRTISFVRANFREGDGVVFNGPWQVILQSYYPIGDVPTVYLPPQAPPELDPMTAQPPLNEFLQKYRRLWVIPVAVQQADPDRFVASWLNENAHRALELDNLALYYAPPVTSTLIVSAPLRFGQALELDRAELDTRTVAAGDAVLATLTWRARQPNDGDVQVILEAIDPGGEVWGQRIYRPGERFVSGDEWNSGKPILDRQALPLDPGAPPGAYRLRITVQRASTGATLPLADGSDPTYAQLATLQVTAPGEHIADGRLLGNPVNVRFGDGFELIAYRLPSDEFVQGGIVPITLYWRALDGNRDVDVDVALVDQAGKVIDVSRGPLGPAWYRAAQWQPDEVVATTTALHVPPRLEPGAYHLQVSAHDRTGEPLKASGILTQDGFLKLWTAHVPAQGETWTIGDVALAARERNFTMPTPQHSVSINFGDQIQLLGYDLDTSDAHPGGQARVTFYWKALQPGDQNYVVFTHLIDPSGQQQGQRDSMPAGGLNPTPFWQTGEVIADTYTIDIDPNAVAGPYTLDFGWYQSDTGQRLPALAADGTRFRDDIAQIGGVPVAASTIR